MDRRSFTNTNRSLVFAKQNSPAVVPIEETGIMMFLDSIFIICCVLSLFGLGANVVNTIIFYRHGFENSVNISFFGLAISDFATLITALWTCACMNPLFYTADIYYEPREIQYLSAGVPHVIVGRITSFFTAFLTVERCLGIILPLKMKRIVTQRKIIVILTSIVFINVLSVIPVYLEVDFGWKFREDKNRSILGIVYKEDSKDAGLAAFILAPLLGLLSLLIVVIFTAILIFELRQKSKWRTKVTRDGQKAGTISAKDRNTVKMVLLIASTLIICNIPAAILTAITIAIPEFSIMGGDSKIFLGMWSIPIIFQAFNSSVNIFFYYHMSTNYRQSFHELFSIGNKQ